MSKPNFWLKTFLRPIIHGTSILLDKLDTTPQVKFTHVATEDKERTQFHNFTVLTLNIRGLPWPWRKNHERDFKQILTTMFSEHRYSPDVICLQEVFSSKCETLLDGLKAYGYTILRGPGRWGNYVGSGLVIATRHEISSHGYICYEDACISRNCLYNKAMLYAKIMIGDQPVNIINTHLQAKDYLFCTEKEIENVQVRQVQKMKLALSSWIDNKYPVVTVGDFNFKPSFQAFMELEESVIMGFSAQRKLLEKMKDDEQSIDYKTFKRHVIDGEFFEESVDHQFYRGNLDPIFGRHCFAPHIDGVEPSDHWGLMVSYQFQ